MGSTTCNKYGLTSNERPVRWRFENENAVQDCYRGHSGRRSCDGVRSAGICRLLSPKRKWHGRRGNWAIAGALLRKAASGRHNHSMGMAAVAVVGSSVARNNTSWLYDRGGYGDRDSVYRPVSYNHAVATVAVMGGTITVRAITMSRLAAATAMSASTLTRLAPPQRTPSLPRPSWINLLSFLRNRSPLSSPKSKMLPNRPGNVP